MISDAAMEGTPATKAFSEAGAESEQPQGPALSVVLTTPTGLPQLYRTLLSVAAQTIAERVELVVVATSEAIMEGAEPLLERFHSHQIIAMGEIPNVDHAAARGLLAAKAPIVASIEDHAYPEPDWAEHLLEGYTEDTVAVGSAMLNANPSTLSWSNMLLAYGQYNEFRQLADTEMIALHNGTYRRAALEPYGEDLWRMFNRESEILVKLHEAGGRFRFTPKARIRHLNPSKISSTAQLRFDAGRLYAAKRAEEGGWGLPKRIVYTALGPAIPLLRYVRMRQSLFGERRDVKETREGPALLLGLIFDAAGQMFGYVAGIGGARDRLATFEMDRLDHLGRKDLATFTPMA